jgi:hypothetical protein
LLLSLDGDGAPALRATAASWSDRVVFVADRPAADGPLPIGQALLVRPDGYVAWAGSDSGSAGLAQALTRWFGAPAADDD